MKDDERGDSAPSEADDFELPDPRAVNRRIREEAKLAKARETVSRRGKGAWKHLLDEACAGKRAHDVKAQLNYLYANGILVAGIGLEREVGHETSTKHSESMENVFGDLRALGMNLKDVRHLSRKHVVALCKYWISQGQVPATVQTKVSIMRRFLTLIGKPEVMPKGPAWTRILREAGIDTAKLKRSYVAQVSKSWFAAGVDPRVKIEEVWADSPVCGAALLLQLIAGMRVRESLSDSPMTMDCGDFLRLEKGTKGRRKRDVRLAVSEEQFAAARVALDRVKKVAAALPRKILCLPGKDIKQMRRHFYYVMAKHGITMNGDGIVPHGLRHGFLQQRYEETSELPAPVLRLAPVLAYEENATAVAAAKSQVSGDAGHSRDASYHYTGNTIAMTREAREAERAILAAVSQSTEIMSTFAEAGVLTAWLVGRIAYGVKLEAGQALEVLVLLAPASEPSVVQELQAVMEKALDRLVTVSASFDALRRPEVGTEIVFAEV